MGRGGRVVLAAAAVLASVLGGVSYAQRYFREGGFPTLAAPPVMPDSAFVVCRLAYNRVRAEESGIGWQTDYPYAEINLSTRFSELTKTHVSRSEDGSPNHWVVSATDPTLFNCPILVASDAGTVGFSQAEVEGLRAYLQKGGFLWADDFWGTAAWEHWQSEIQKVLPPPQYLIEDVALDDPMLSAMYQVDHVPQITNIQFWRRNNGYTSERGADSEEVHMRTIRDDHRRVMVVMTHNTDVADSWEREGEDIGFFMQFSPPGYRLGIDVLVHVMTH